MNVIIGIGYNGSQDPAGFRDQVAKVITRLGTLHADIEGRSSSEPWGAEPGTWFAAEFEDHGAYFEARARILAVGAAHGQDAVAFTVGTTDVADCPRAERAGYRGLPVVRRAPTGGAIQTG